MPSAQERALKDRDADLEYNLQHATSITIYIGANERGKGICMRSVTQCARVRGSEHLRLIAVKGQFYIGFWVKRRDFACRGGP